MRGTIYQRGNVWWIKYYRNGKPYFESSKSTKKGDAEKLLNLKAGDIARGVPVTPQVERTTFEELAAAVVDDYRMRRKQNAVKRTEERLALHLTPFFGGLRASQVTTDYLRGYIVTRQEAGAANGTINRELAVVKRAFRLGMAATPPKVLFAPKIPKLEEASPRAGFFDRADLEAVRRHLPAPLKAVVTFAYVTGWRRGEVLSLQWRQVDFEGGWLRLEPGTTKNKKARNFPFTPELRVLLEAQRAETDRLQRERGEIIPHVFHRRGEPIRDYYAAWHSACLKAGLAGRIPHDFRRSAVRNLTRAGVSESVAMQLSGHKTRSVFDRYNITDERDLLDAAEKLHAAATVTKQLQSAVSGSRSGSHRSRK